MAAPRRRPARRGGLQLRCQGTCVGPLLDHLVRPSRLAIAPHDVAAAWSPPPPLAAHALLLGHHEIVQGIAVHVHETMLPEQRLDLLSRPAPEEWELVADCLVLRAHAGILPRRGRAAMDDLAVHDNKASSG